MKRSVTWPPNRPDLDEYALNMGSRNEAEMWDKHWLHTSGIYRHAEQEILSGLRMGVCPPCSNLIYSIESDKETYSLSSNARGVYKCTKPPISTMAQPDDAHIHSHVSRDNWSLKLQFPQLPVATAASHDGRQFRQTIVPALRFTQLFSSVAPSCSSSHLVVRKVSFSTSISELFLFSPFMVLRSSG